MVKEAATDRQFLRSKLRARASIYDYRVPAGSLVEWALDLVDWPDGACALDVGCGPGFYLQALWTRNVHGVGIDLSPGMAAEAARHAPTAVADAAMLPFPTAAFDRVLAPHMLYHCPDIPRAVAELRRILRRDGVLIAVTNSTQHLHELREIRERFDGGRHVVSERFSVENGADFLATAFDDVNVVHFDGELRVPEVKPVGDYLASMMTWYGDPDAASTTAKIEREVAEIIERDGLFRIRTAVGVFVCR